MPADAPDRAPRLRRGPTAFLVAGTLVPVVLLVGFGHRGQHAVRSMLVPGAGLLEARPLLAGLFLASIIPATIAWLRWGMDWVLVALVITAMAASAAWGTTTHEAATATVRPLLAAHEFPIVVLVVGFLGWVRSVIGRVPGMRWVGGRHRTSDAAAIGLGDLPVPARCRAVALQTLAGTAGAAGSAALTAPDVERRARRVGVLARARHGGDPFRVDHAPTRAALALTGRLDADGTRRFLGDAAASRVGLPASEPTWVRTLDATLAAVALTELGDDAAAGRCRALLDGPLRARRGHRPGAYWTPFGVPVGRCLDWEHATATAIACSRGWIDGTDWPLLRKRVLGAAARGSGRRDDERLIAAGRMWLALVDDPAAAAIVARPTVRHDPIAVALDQYAKRLADGAIRSVEQ